MRLHRSVFYSTKRDLNGRPLLRIDPVHGHHFPQVSRTLNHRYKNFRVLVLLRSRCGNQSVERFSRPIFGHCLFACDDHGGIYKAVYSTAQDNDTSRWCNQASSICEVPDPVQRSRCFDVIFQFGDSLGDSGNYATLLPSDSFQYPNGYTWPGCFKGRYSDGRLLVDYYATEFGVVLPRPWSACQCGTNFAVANATALSVKDFSALKISVSVPYSIKDQLKWYKKYLSTYRCSRPTNGLYILGIGGVDYILASQAGVSSADMIKNLVPQVVKSITGAIEMLSKYGAKNILVENLPPAGCTPRLLTELEETDRIDGNGCLTDFSRVIEAHNSQLTKAIFDQLNVSDNVIVALEDRYSAFYEIWQNPSANGFDNPRVACCGGGGPYNFNPSEVCGMKGAAVCGDPSKSLFWDSVHFSDHYNGVVSRAFLSGRFVNSSVGANPLAAMC